MVLSEKVTFQGALGEPLAGRLEQPSGPPRGAALFAHCFTCTKDSFAASRISRALAQQGFAVLRFDFTGIGGSDGDFENTNFTSNVQDLLAAAAFLRARGQAPQLLVGHSLGGAAVLMAAPEIAECRAVATIGAPADPAQLRHLVRDSPEEIARRGDAQLEIGGRRFTVSRQFLEDLARYDEQQRIDQLGRALLLMHSPADTVVGIDNARRIFAAAKHPKSFVSLDGADHLLTQRCDSEFVSSVVASWARRYLEHSTQSAGRPLVVLGEDFGELAHGQVRVRDTGNGAFQEVLRLGRHLLLADEPRAMGGDDTGPTPYELLLGALGACTAMTVRMYARRKRWPLQRVEVSLGHSRRHVDDCDGCEQPGTKLDVIEASLELSGDLTPEQRQRLLEIANKCPVNKTLTSPVRIVSQLAQPERS